MISTATGGPTPAAPPRPVIALGGLAVLLVVLQGSGGFTVELLGADLLLAVAGFRVTHTPTVQPATTDRFCTISGVCRWAPPTP